MKDFENVTFWFENNGSVKGFPSIDFHDVEIGPRMGHFVEDVMTIAKEQIEGAGFENIVLEKAEGLAINFIKDGEFFGSTKIGVYIDYVHAEDELPNGDTLVSLEYYDWNGYECLQKAA